MEQDKIARNDHNLILLTGASGYVGGRLLTVLQKDGFRVRCLARRPEYLQPRLSSGTEAVAGDVMNKESLFEALNGVHTAYYLIHSMGSSQNFEELDRQAARNFGEAACACGVKRIIYLGGLGEDSDDLSPHLRSRQEVGSVLASYEVPVSELRASIVIGSGSLSFEMIRALVERLPVMITPRWVAIKAQPIAITDLLQYLVAALEVETAGHRIFEIGGTDRMSYEELMREYARQRGLRRLMIPVPVLTPRLSSLWLGLVTPLYARIGRKLVDSLRHETIVQSNEAREVFDIEPKGVREAIAEALTNEDKEIAETRWSDAISSAGQAKNWGGVRFGNRLVDHRELASHLPAKQIFKVVQRIGGESGWYYADWLWHLRGFFDLLLGGVGMRRGRRHPEAIRIGDTIDWWRVEAYQPNKKLRLLAEMKLPGRAWLEFSVEQLTEQSLLKQTAIFEPAGLLGLAYWYLVYPLHSLIFGGMLRGIINAAKMPDGENSGVDEQAQISAAHENTPEIPHAQNR